MGHRGCMTCLKCAAAQSPKRRCVKVTLYPPFHVQREVLCTSLSYGCVLLAMAVDCDDCCHGTASLLSVRTLAVDIAPARCQETCLSHSAA